MNSQNLQPLNSKELVETNGGSFTLFLLGVVVGIVIADMIKNRHD